MPNLTKQDIDALVDAMRPEGGSLVYLEWEGCVSWLPVADVRRNLYLAAGLTAEGERKPEKVKCWLVTDPPGNRQIYFRDPEADGFLNLDCWPDGWLVTLGTFIPDSPEPR